MHPLDRLFHPRSVAVLGASSNPQRPGYRFTRSVIESGFQGPIFPINPKGGERFGRRIDPSLDAVEEEIDLVLNMLSPTQTPEALVAAARRGVRIAVIYTAGFGEMGEEGARLQAQMVVAVRSHGMRIVGPNCMGIFSMDSGLNMTGQLNLPRGPIGMISQSGNVGITLWYDAPRLDILADEVERHGFEMPAFSPDVRKEIAAMLRELRGFALLSGLRSRPAADLQALEDLLFRLLRTPLAERRRATRALPTADRLSVSRRDGACPHPLRADGIVTGSMRT